MKVHVRNKTIDADAWVAPSRVPHLSPGWEIVQDTPVMFRPGTEEPIDAPQGVVASTETPEEK